MHSPLAHIAELTSCAFSTYPQCYLSEFRPTTWPRPCLCPMQCPQKWTWYLCLTWFPLTFFPHSHSPQKQTFCNFCRAKATNPVRSETGKQGALRKAEEGDRRLLSGALMFHLLFLSLPSIISLESLEKRQHQKALSLEIDLNNLEQLKERVARQGEVQDVARLASLGLQPCQVQDLPPPDAGECLHPPQQGPLCCKPCY